MRKKQLCSGFAFLIAPLLVAGCSGPDQQGDGIEANAASVWSFPLAEPHAASFTVDNMAVTLSSSLPFADFSASAPGAARQIAWSVSHNPFRYVGIQVIPYGFGSPLERDFVAEAGTSARHRQMFTARRADEPAAARPRELTATLFDEPVVGAAYVRPDEHAVGGYQGTAEFTTEAGGRVWIVGVSEELSSDDIEPFFASLRELSLSSSELDRTTTLVHPPLRSRSAQPEIGADPAGKAKGSPPSSAWYGQQIPVPYWWGDSPCDHTYYWNHTPANVPAAALLTPGAHVPNPWNGLQACGPNPYLYGSAADVVRTFPGGHGEYEFECVELSMRFLYGAYGVNAYSADGNGVANNYSTAYGGGLQRIVNGGAPPLPVAGDVLQYTCGTHGHTSVVVSESHNASGTGGLYVIEQNNGPGAGNYIAETNWSVGCDSSGCCVNAWLHQP